MSTAAGGSDWTVVSKGKYAKGGERGGSRGRGGGYARGRGRGRGEGSSRGRGGRGLKGRGGRTDGRKQPYTGRKRSGSADKVNWNIPMESICKDWAVTTASTTAAAAPTATAAPGTTKNVATAGGTAEIPRKAGLTKQKKDPNHTTITTTTGSTFATKGNAVRGRSRSDENNKNNNEMQHKKDAKGKETATTNQQSFKNGQGGSYLLKAAAKATAENAAAAKAVEKPRPPIVNVWKQKKSIASATRKNAADASSAKLPAGKIKKDAVNSTASSRSMTSRGANSTKAPTSKLTTTTTSQSKKAPTAKVATTTTKDRKTSNTKSVATTSSSNTPPATTSNTTKASLVSNNGTPASAKTTAVAPNATATKTKRKSSFSKLRLSAASSEWVPGRGFTPVAAAAAVARPPVSMTMPPPHAGMMGIPMRGPGMYGTPAPMTPPVPTPGAGGPPAAGTTTVVTHSVNAQGNRSAGTKVVWKPKAKEWTPSGQS
eukprot:g1893.t1